MSDILEVRRANLRMLTSERGSVAALARKLGGKSSITFISQMRAPLARSAGKRVQPMTENTAREMEEKLLLPRGWFDVLQEGAPAIASASTIAGAPDSATVTRWLKKLHQLVALEKIDLSFDKFANLFGLAYSDAIEHGGELRVDHLKRLVDLLR